MSDEMIKVGVPQCPLCEKRFTSTEELNSHACPEASDEQ